MEETNCEIKYEIKYRYLLYRVQQALIEIHGSKTCCGRRHLENGLYTCEQTLDPTKYPVTHEEMTTLKSLLYGPGRGVENEQ